MTQQISLPKSSAHQQFEQLGYLESYDAVVDQFYAFLVYAETAVSSGKMTIKIKSKNTAGTAIAPDNRSLLDALRKAAAREEPYLVWGFNLSPSDTDPRMVENRIHINADGQPQALEIVLVTRRKDGSAGEPKSLRVDWPG